MTAPHTFAPAARALWGTEPTGSAGEYSFDIRRPDNILLVAAGGGDDSLVLYPHVATTVSAEVTFDGSRGRMVPDEGATC